MLSRSPSTENLLQKKSYEPVILVTNDVIPVLGRPCNPNTSLKNSLATYESEYIARIGKKIGKFGQSVHYHINSITPKSCDEIHRNYLPLPLRNGERLKQPEQICFLSLVPLAIITLLNMSQDVLLEASPSEFLPDSLVSLEEPLMSFHR